MSSKLQRFNSKDKLSEWVKQVEECRNSGMKVADWCHEYGISVSAYYQHQKKVYEMMKPSETPECFYEVGTSVSVMQNQSVAALQYGEYRTEIYPGADEETIYSCNTRFLGTSEFFV